MPVAQLLPMLMGSGGGGQSGGGVGQALANTASGIFSGIVGLGQRRKAKRLLAGLQRPEYMIPNEVLQNQKMAERATAEGLPSQQYNQAMQNIQRQQNRALTAAGSRRGALMALPGLQQQANDALLNLDVKDAQARMANQQRLYGINSQVGQYRDKAFEINKMQPYQRDYGYAQSLLGMGNQNLYGGIERLIAGGGQFADAAMKMNSGGGGGKSNKSKSSSYDFDTPYNSSMGTGPSGFSV